MLMISKGTLPRLFFLIAIVLAMPAEVIAMSRAAWLAAATGLGLFFAFLFLHPTLRMRSVVTSCVAMVVGMAVLIAFIGPISQRLLKSKDDSTTAREIYKADARRMITAAPWFGMGLNSYVFELPNYGTLAMKSYGDQPPAVHNIFYLWWAETGIVGMGIFCLIWAWIICAGFANLTVRDELLFVVNAGCLAALIGLIPDSFLSFTLRVNTTLRLFWLLAGIIMAIRYLRIQERHDLSLQTNGDPLPAVAQPVGLPSQ
jgi:O-antigen ligase